jgi:ATP-dependent RNA helicase DDX60
VFGPYANNYVLDFSLVLATIVTSLTNFIRPGQNGDMDMIDIQGGGDLYESAQAEVGLEGVDDESGGNSSGEDDEGIATAPPAWKIQGGGHQSLLKVLQAFQMLKTEFDAKFKAMWA